MLFLLHATFAYKITFQIHLYNEKVSYSPAFVSFHDRNGCVFQRRYARTGNRTAHQPDWLRRNTDARSLLLRPRTYAGGGRADYGIAGCGHLPHRSRRPVCREYPYDDSDRIQDEAYNGLRPEVANLPDAETIAAYDTLFVGSPCWWHQPAMVVCTFLESYDLSGKVVIPFFTYGATTYLNESMQTIYRATPDSEHLPATLPEDLDPDNIREPQSDDAGIDMPGNANGVEAWLQRMGFGK